MSAQFNAGLRRIVNPSTLRGGQLRFVRTDDFESLDPGNCYYACTWNFLRLFGRTLVTFAQFPGVRGQRLVPDLATSLGVATEHGRTWTYHLRPDLRFEDGSEVTSYDIRYAIERSNFASHTMANGPTYFRQYLDARGQSHGFVSGLGPPPSAVENLTANAITTPDRRTISFHLSEPFLGFDYLAALPSTVPVPRNRDTGARYTDHPVATGPFRIGSYVPGQRLTLIKNPYWSHRSDLIRRRFVDEIVVQLGVDPVEVDQQLLAGAADLDLAGMGVQPETQDLLLRDHSFRQHADNPLNGYTWMYCMAVQVAPLDSLHARRAVQYATSKAAMQEAYGGKIGGDIASTVLPPSIEGYRGFDLYPTGPDASGDLQRAKHELTLAGLPNGFRTKIAARSDRAKEFGAAHALSAALTRVGIVAEVIGFPSSEYFSTYAGVPAYVRENGLGILMSGWGADFPDGLGFLQQIVDSRAIKQTGNQNLGELRNAAIDSLLDLGAKTDDQARRAELWARIDRAVMETAVICPYLYARSLLYRGPRVTNIYVSGAYGMYDYSSLGVVPDVQRCRQVAETTGPAQLCRAGPWPT